MISYFKLSYEARSMVQNRNKFITLFIGNLSNAILHQILEQSINDDALTHRYHKESITSLALAKKYRAKIHPLQSSLPESDSTYVGQKILQKVNVELHLRISKGYRDIDLSLVEPSIDKALRESKIL